MKYLRTVALVALCAILSAINAHFTEKALRRHREHITRLTRRVWRLEGSPTYHGDGINPDVRA